MAYPVVEGTATSIDSDRTTTTLSMNLPVGISVGETLIGLACNRAASAAPSFPAGWTELWSAQSTDGDDLGATVAIRLADGTESGTIAVTVEDNPASGIIYRISGAVSPANFMPPVASDKHTGGSIVPGGVDYTAGSLNDYGLLGSAYGRYDRYLGIVACFHSDDFASVENYPDNYSNFTEVYAGAGSGCGTKAGYRDIQSVGEFFPRWRIDDDVNKKSYNVGFVIYPEERYVPPSTFPYINKVAFTPDSNRSASTTFKLKLPPLEPGDIIIAGTSQYDQQNDSITWPAGWTELYDLEDGGGNADINGSAAWKKADGSEGSTITLTCGPNPICGVAFSVNNIPDPDITPFEWNVEVGTSTSAGAGSITPSAGSGNYLWVGMYHRETDSTEYSDFPDNYDGRFVGKGDWPNNTEDPMIVIAHSNDEIARTALSSDYVVKEGLQAAWIATQFVFHSGSFDPGNWWYLNWRGKGRNGFM